MQWTEADRLHSGAYAEKKQSPGMVDIDGHQLLFKKNNVRCLICCGSLENRWTYFPRSRGNAIMATNGKGECGLIPEFYDNG